MGRNSGSGVGLLTGAFERVVHWLGAILIAVALLAGTSASVLAAMDGRLSSDHGRVGDLVQLVTDDNAGRANYSELITAGPERIYLLPVGVSPPADSCAADGSVPIGLLRWSASVGSLTFTIPDVSKGQYFLLMQISDQCWRIGGRRSDGSYGPLVLSVGDVPAAPILATPSPSKSASVSGEPSSVKDAWFRLPGVLAVAAAAIALALLLGAFAKRR
jgi:hypothetical protein